MGPLNPKPKWGCGGSWILCLGLEAGIRGPGEGKIWGLGAFGEIGTLSKSCYFSLALPGKFRYAVGFVKKWLAF